MLSIQLELLWSIEGINYKKKLMVYNITPWHISYQVYQLICLTDKQQKTLKKCRSALVF